MKKFFLLTLLFLINAYFYITYSMLSLFCIVLCLSLFSFHIVKSISYLDCHFNLSNFLSIVFKFMFMTFYLIPDTGYEQIPQSLINTDFGNSLCWKQSENRISKTQNKLHSRFLNNLWGYIFCNINIKISLNISLYSFFLM